MTLAAAMLIGPGEADRHLERCMSAAREWADKIIVYADAVDIDTVNVILDHADVAQFGREPLFLADEKAARDNLFEICDRELDPGDIVLLLDADEQVAQDPLETARRLTSLPTGESWWVSFLHLWDPEGTLYRADGLWYPAVGCRIYRHRPGMRAARTQEGSWVCHPLPKSHMWPATQRPILDILHWSYARPEDRQPKFERYTALTGHADFHVQSIIDKHPTLRPVPERF